MSCLVDKSVSPSVSLDAQTEMTDLDTVKTDVGKTDEGKTDVGPQEEKGATAAPVKLGGSRTGIKAGPLRLKKDSAYGTATCSIGEVRRPSVMRSNSEARLSIAEPVAVDYFELFCAQAGYKPPRRLSRADDFGGSMPCLVKDQTAQGEGGFRPMGATEEGYFSRNHLNLDYAMSLPLSKGLKRVPSDHGPRRASRIRGLSPCLGDDGAVSPMTSPRSPLRSPIRSPLCSPCTPSRAGSLKKSRSGKLWSSIKNLLEGCSDPSFALDCTDQLSPPPQCKSPCRSAPHSRSSSVKRRRPRNQEVANNGIRRRTSSLGSRSSLKRPTTLSLDQKSNTPQKVLSASAQEGKLIRNFVITPKGFINRGDSIRSRSVTSVYSLGSGGSLDDWRQSRTSLTSVGPSHHRVLMIGGSGVGKTTLSQQFVTSEGVNVELVDEEKSTTSVSILLDGTESTLDFIDLQYGENHRDFLDIDAYVVMYSAADRATFHASLDLLYDIRKNMHKSDAIILVANKTDLVRVRQVAPEEGKSSAVTYDCKYLEVSALMNHQVDELLAGTLTQIRLHRKPSERNKEEEGCRSPMALIGRFLKRQGTYSKSCDNLLVL